jgi:uncharacterized protein YbjT (DUF2867 family)
MRVLVAGATGVLGRHVVASLVERGDEVRVLSRRSGAIEIPGVEVRRGDALDAGSLEGACRDVDVVISALGASVTPSLGARAGFGRVDVRAHANLIAEAKRAGVGRFVYVSVAEADHMRALAYVRAHLDVEEQLARSGLAWTAVRPTGFFSAFAPFLTMARRGLAVQIGDGTARSNPIHDADVAAACVDVLESGPQQLEIGGPDVLTRRQILELAFAAVGRRPRIVRVPVGMIRAVAALVRPVHPRNGEILAFVAHVMSEDAIVAARGSRRLADAFAELAGRA